MRISNQSESLYGFSEDDRVLDPTRTTAVQTISRLTGTVVKVTEKLLRLLWDSGRIEEFRTADPAALIRKAEPGEDW